jgi:hypothetical protein
MRPDSDDYLVRYLLGDVPADEAERLDERSVTDDEFALRLRVLEHDLADRIARGEAPEVSLEQFGGRYQLSPYLRDKVRFAEALHTLTSSAQPIVSVRRPSDRLAWRSLAAAAVLILALAGYLAVRNTQLRDEVGRIDARRDAIQQQHAGLQQELERARAALTTPISPLTATVMLRPPRRGLGNDTATVSIPKGTEQVVIRVQVESEAHGTFWAALRDVASSGIVWRSPDLPAEGSASERTVAMTVPASFLRAGLYSVELTVSTTGSADVLGHYPIRVVLE